MQQDDLLGAHRPLRQTQRADHIIGDHPTSVANNVGLTAAKSQDSEDRHTGIHASHNRGSTSRRNRHAPKVKRLGVVRVVGQQFVRRWLKVIGHGRIVDAQRFCAVPQCRASLAYERQQRTNRDRIPKASHDHHSHEPSRADELDGFRVDGPARRSVRSSRRRQRHDLRDPHRDRRWFLLRSRHPRQHATSQHRRHDI